MLDALTDTASSPVFITLLLVIGAVIQVLKTLVLGKEKLTEVERQALSGWRRVFFVTRRLQALAIGALVGLGMNAVFGFEAPASYEVRGAGGAVLFCMLAGAAAQLAYTALIGAFRDWIATKSRA